MLIVMVNPSPDGIELVNSIPNADCNGESES